MAHRAIIFDTEQEALTRSHSEAVSRGVSDSDTTNYWWTVSESVEGNWCCWIVDDIVPDPVVFQNHPPPPEE